VNKTPLAYSTNRTIGGDAPSKYLKRVETQSGLVVLPAGGRSRVDENGG
jgi:hypothetical protein